jgi:hypothetical protein
MWSRAAAPSRLGGSAGRARAGSKSRRITLLGVAHRNQTCYHWWSQINPTPEVSWPKAAAPKFKDGRIDGVQKRDESGVAAVEFIPLVREYEFEQQALASLIGVDEGYLSNILSFDAEGQPKQPWIGLRLADNILHALGASARLQELVIIPGHQQSDARQMAYYESLDDNDQPRRTVEQIMERAEELWGIREMMLSGDPEMVEFVRSQVA